MHAHCVPDVVTVIENLNKGDQLIILVLAVKAPKSQESSLLVSIAAVTVHQKFSDLKQHTFIISFVGRKSKISFNWAKVKVSAGLVP